MKGYSCIKNGIFLLTCAWCDAEHGAVGEIQSSRLDGWLYSSFGWLCPTCSLALPAMAALIFEARGYDEHGVPLRVERPEVGG